MLLFEACLILLFIKHVLCDFIWYSDRLRLKKEAYGDISGIRHAAIHGICTFLIFGIALLSGTIFALLLGALDAILHYHFEWFRLHYGCKETNNKLYWKHIGVLQLLHSLTYLMFVSIFIRST